MSFFQKRPKALVKNPTYSLIKPPHISKITRIVVHYDCGFGNNLFIRGEHAGLDWKIGAPLNNINAGKWTFEITSFFTECFFKILINDTCYEQGTNHHISCGKVIIIEPKF